MKAFKKGQTVYWGELKGEITDVDNQCMDPLTVKFEGIITTFTFKENGRYLEDLPPVLSITPYTLTGFSQEPQIEKDTVVYVRDNETDKWEMRYYSHFKYGIHYCYIEQLKSTETDILEAWVFLETENPLLKY